MSRDVPDENKGNEETNLRHLLATLLLGMNLCPHFKARLPFSVSNGCPTLNIFDDESRWAPLGRYDNI